MAQLRRTIDGDQHFYIKVGPSIGTKQITKDGLIWLKKHNYSFPSPGGWVQLDLGDYRYLEKQNYLYTKGEISTESFTQPLNLLPLETAHYGAPLLLQLDDIYLENPQNADWILILKLDEWEQSARDELLQNQAVAVGCYTLLDGAFQRAFSSVSLQQIHRPDYWPEVAPQMSDYTLYWQSDELYQENSQSSHPLKQATPPAGLKTGWQGNVFFRFENGGLTNTWKRYLPNMSISATAVHKWNECYWLAQSHLRPEPPWPGKAQLIGKVKQGWQLWRLQTVPETNLEDMADWLNYRQIRLIYPQWRLRLLNPLSVDGPEHQSTCIPGQPLLIRCDPSTQHTENGHANVILSLTPYVKGTNTLPDRQLAGSPARSQPLSHNGENYLCAPIPPSDQKYRISLSGEASGLSMWVQTAPLTIRQPTWLHGLHTTVLIADKPYFFEAFNTFPRSASYRLVVEKDFSLHELAQASWQYQPSGIPCSLRWKYLSPQKNVLEDKVEGLSTGDKLTDWWQTSIWPEVAASPWVILTLDASSFGTICLHLVLQPESATSEDSLISTGKQQIWWTNGAYATHFLWLSSIAANESGQAQKVVSLSFSRALEQLCEPGTPGPLKKALRSLAERRSLPAWIYLRLQSLLADLYSTPTTDHQRKTVIL